jgi:lipopolysaccharide biosynthesis regulator YciM
LDIKKVFIEILKPLFGGFKDRLNKFYQNILKLEKENLKESQMALHRSGPLKKIDLKQGIKDKLAEAEKLSAEQSFNDAEEICISIIELDPKNVEAYEILIKIYTEKKEYKKARETCRYLIKLLIKNKAEEEGSVEKHRLANCYADLGTVYQLEQKNSLALKNFQKAVDLESNNPRFLDLLLKISIILEDKNLALQVFNALKKANPDNQKLNEIKDQINQIKGQG